MTLPCHGALAASAVPDLDLHRWGCQGAWSAPRCTQQPGGRGWRLAIGDWRWWGMGPAGAAATAAAWAERGPVQQAGARGAAGRSLLVSSSSGATLLPVPVPVYAARAAVVQL
ncbi:hypothetical protein N5D37_17510 [Comamonas aquatica]|uniref:hypothetical protein n=1 Tax=Comamonas aquatica TaxID=225991 RepID=UPI00244CBAC3|nr:hypothetical protein [Comamonas aquatica]MDH1767404.1 hypothetical protein [Comamonas aquatica]